MMDLKIQTLISQEKIEQRVAELAEQINKDYAGKELYLICILKGSIFFTCELAKQLTMPVKLDFMSVSSYGDDTVSSKKITIKKDLEEDIAGKDILIIADIIDTGLTMNCLKKLLAERKPAGMKVCTLLDKSERRLVTLDVEYTGFEIPDQFVVGYGMDYAQKYRNLPYIGIIE